MVMALMEYFPLAQCVCFRHLIMQNIWVEGATFVLFVFRSTTSLLLFLCKTFFCLPLALMFFEMVKPPTSLPKVIWQGDSDSFSFWQSEIVRWTNLLILVLFYGRKKYPFQRTVTQLQKYTAFESCVQ